VDEAQRRDLALGRLAPAARQVAHAQAPAPEQRAADELEVAARHRARGGADDAHPLHHLARFGGVGAEHGVELVLHRLQMTAEHAVGVQPGDQLVHRQQGVDLGLAEPDAGQLMRHTARRGLCREAVDVVPTVVDDRRVEPVAQVLKIALERRGRHFQRLAKRLEAHAAAVADPVRSCRSVRCGPSERGLVRRR
jgi:hypothetical protein